MSEFLSGLVEWVTDVIYSLGYLGVAVLVALENVFPPIPSELILPLAGFLVGQGRFQIVPVVVAATIGSVAGALILYGMGYWLGERRIRELTRRFGRFALIGEDDLDKAQDWFDRHDRAAVLIGRLVPGIRSLISVPAGLVRMSLGQFVVYTAVGSGAWNMLLIGLGWALGEQWHLVGQYVEILQYIVLAAIAAAVVWFIWQRRQQLFQ